MRRWISLLLLLLSTSCVTPDMWKPEDHRRQMLQCRVMCGKFRVRSYDTITAECQCHKSVREALRDD